MTSEISVERSGEDEPSQRYAKGAVKVVGVDLDFNKRMKEYITRNWGWLEGVHHFGNSSVKYMFDIPPDMEDECRGIAAVMVMAKNSVTLEEDIAKLLLDLESNGLSGFSNCPYHPNPIAAYYCRGDEDA